jgi:hypothetical protein
MCRVKSLDVMRRALEMKERFYILRQFLAASLSPEHRQFVVAI